MIRVSELVAPARQFVSAHRDSLRKRRGDNVPACSLRLPAPPVANEVTLPT